MPIVATGGSCRDQDHRRALQSLLSGKLPRADRYHLGVRRRVDAVLSDGRSAARRVDEAASRRAPGGMAVRDWKTGWQGSLGWKATFLAEVRRQFDRRRVVNASYSESAHVDLLCERSSIAPLVSSSAAPISEYLFCRRRTWLWAGSTDLQGLRSDFPLLKDLRARPQFPSIQITNAQDYYGCARYAGSRGA